MPICVRGDYLVKLRVNRIIILVLLFLVVFSPLILNIAGAQIPHIVMGQITCQGVGQVGADVQITTSQGTWNTTSLAAGPFGAGSFSIFINVIPGSDTIAVVASFGGCGWGTDWSPDTGGLTIIDVDMNPPPPPTTTTTTTATVNPCDCVAQGYYPQCTYWLIPGCNLPDPRPTADPDWTKPESVKLPAGYMTTTVTTTATSTTTTTSETTTTIATTRTSTTTSTTAEVTTTAPGINAVLTLTIIVSSIILAGRLKR